jgi:hypothetical protein
VNSQEVKDILLLYRPGTGDEADPEFANALELAARDPDLRTWFEKHCALQITFLKGFDAIQVPAGLKEQIISERVSHQLQQSRKRMVLVAAVALVLGVLALASFLPNTGSSNRFTLFSNRMVGDVQRAYPQMDLETNSEQEIRAYLAKQGRGDYVLPKPLEKVATTGCKVLRWHDKPVTMICFNSGAKSNPTTPDLFLFVIERSNVTAPPPDSPRFSPAGNLTTAGWTNGDKVYLLAAAGDEAFLRRQL